jgi:hypothetical protein
MFAFLTKVLLVVRSRLTGISALQTGRDLKT